MTFGADSNVFQAWVQQMVANSGTGFAGLDADSCKVALFNDTTTPDKDAAVADTGYNTGVWVTANEEDDGTNWDAGGEPLTSPVVSDEGSGITQFDAADTSQGGATCTLSNVYGCFVYDDDITGGTVVDQGVSYHSFGGAQGVTNGTFTVVWHANGLWRATV